MAQQADVKINGDATDAVKALEDVGAAAEATQGKLDGVGKKGAEAGEKAQNPWKEGLGLFKDLLPRNLQMLQRRFESTSRQVGRMGGSFKILGAAIKAVPIFLIIEGFRWIIDNWEKISDFLTGTTVGMKAMKESVKEAAIASREFGNQAKSLALVIQDGNMEMRDREQALKNLQKIMPEVEGMTLAQATAEGVLEDAMRKRGRAEAQMALQRRLYQDLADAQLRQEEAQAAYEDNKRTDAFSMAYNYLVNKRAVNQAMEDQTRITTRLNNVNRELAAYEADIAAAAEARAAAAKAEADALRAAEEAKRKAEADAKARAEMNRKLDRELALAAIADERARARKELEYQKADELEKAKLVGASEALLNKIRKKYHLELREMEAGWKAEDEAERQKDLEARQAFWEDYYKREDEASMTDRQIAAQRLLDELASEEERVAELGLSKEQTAAYLLELQRQYLEKLTALENEYIAEDQKTQAEATAKYNETFLTDKEQKLLEVQKEYDELLAIAEKYSLDTVELEAWRAARIKEIENEALEETKSNANAKFQAIMGFTDEIGGLLSQLGDMAEEGSKRQRRLAIAEVLLSQAQAMASAVKGASEAAASTGPGAPFVLAGYIASMLGTILGTFASIKNIIGASGEDSSVTTQSRPIQQAMIPNVTQPSNPQFNIGPVQAYVVESQMQAQLNMTAGVARRARL